MGNLEEAKKLRRGADKLKAKLKKQFKVQIEAAKKAQRIMHGKKEQEEAKKQELHNSRPGLNVENPEGENFDDN